ncbi:MAG: type II secretion system protein N [Myxococcota bacterium]
MAAYLSRTANFVLFCLCCWVVADAANAVLAAVLLPSAADRAGSEPLARPARARTWSDRQIILVRNLFNASTLLPAEVVEIQSEIEDEDLQETTLPLRLLGTAAARDPMMSRAAIEDTEERARLVVGVGDRVKDQATVLRIERRRVVLAENDARRVLSLDDDPEVLARVPKQRRPKRAGAGRSRSAERMMAKKLLEAATAKQTSFLQQARFLPKYVDGEMAGLQVNAIKTGSLVEDAGLENGDVIITANGIAINSAQASAEAFEEMGSSDEIELEVSRADGSIVPIFITTQ